MSVSRYRAGGLEIVSRTQDGHTTIHVTHRPILGKWTCLIAGAVLVGLVALAGLVAFVR